MDRSPVAFGAWGSRSASIILKSPPDFCKTRVDVLSITYTTLNAERRSIPSLLRIRQHRGACLNQSKTGIKQNKYYSSDGWVRSTGSLYIAYVNCAALRPKCIRAEDQSRGVNCVIGRNAHLSRPHPMGSNLAPLPDQYQSRGAGRPRSQ